MNSKQFVAKMAEDNKALFQASEMQVEAYFKSEPTKEALLKAQIKIGTVQESKGSWDTAIEQSHGKDQWSRVGETALACLLLEIYYRYAENSGKMMLKH